jgi:hypothetical protein
MLEGKWRAVSVEGKPFILPTGKPIIVEFARDNYSVNPAQNPKWLDFHSARGTSHAIYRWNGTRLFVKQVPEGLQRPTSFDQKSVSYHPGAKIGTCSMTTYYLERLPN